MSFMRSLFFRRLSVGLLALAVLGLAAPAVADSITDLKKVAGKWTGYGRSPAGTAPLEWTIHESGKVDVVAATPTGNITGVAQVTIKDGKLFYESGTSSGTLTLQEEGGGRRLRYEGLSKRGNNPVGAELTFAR